MDKSKKNMMNSPPANDPFSVLMEEAEKSKNSFTAKTTATNNNTARASSDIPINQPNFIPGYYKDTVSKYLKQSFFKDVQEFKLCTGKKTGYSNLDAIIGSLYPGLYVVGAASSLGKTTFVLQMADQIVYNNEPVIFFTLEQSVLELVSKSISRITALANMKNTMHARTAIQIRQGDISQEVKTAINQYYSMTQMFTIMQGDFQTDMQKIEDTVEDYVKTTGQIPVIMVDYLQIIQETTQLTDKSKVDQITKRLKILQRKYNAVVIAISSINRGNYMLPIDFESFKESGSIEYSADVVWGLQLQVLNGSSFASAKGTAQKRLLIAAAKAESPRKVELVCLKNRYGIASYHCGFYYYPQFDLFRPDPTFKQNSVPNKAPQIIL